MDPFREIFRDLLCILVGMFLMLGLVAMFEFLVARYPDVSLLYKTQAIALTLFQIKTP